MSIFPSRTSPPGALVVETEGAPSPPPTVEAVYASALASAAWATSVFQEAVDELIQANVDLDDVVLRAQSEIDRLTQLRDEATAQRRANVQTVENLQALIG